MKRLHGLLEWARLLLIGVLLIVACIVMMIIPLILLEAGLSLDRQLGISCFIFTKIIALRQVVLLALFFGSNAFVGYCCSLQPRIKAKSLKEMQKGILPISLMAAFAALLVNDIMQLWQVLDFSGQCS